jgi:DNA-binding transcriptional ArsR family regulator
MPSTRSSVTDHVFAALGDSTRRGILELLREHRSLTAGEIATRFPSISRPAVSKHLRVLRTAQLVRAHERGRENHYTLDARPLGHVQREWLDAFAPHWEDSLRRLKIAAEQPAPDR